MNEGKQLRQIFESAAENEQILRRYQDFELRLLDTSELEELLSLLLQKSGEFFELDAVELWLFDPQGTIAELITDEFPDMPNLRLLDHSRRLTRLYGKQAEVRLVSIDAENPLPVLRGRNIGSAALLPLQRQGMLIGSLHLGARGHRRFAEDKSTDFISHMASVVGVCIENAVNNARLHRLCLFDTLTEVKNRRAFHQGLDREVSRAARSGDPLSLLFVDLDHFKAINDTYGHPMGDKVLRTVAQFTQGTLRKIDHVCRYGGEEFALILPNCSQQLALDIAERLRARISELIIENEEDVENLGPTVSVTVSVGACCWLPGDDAKNVSDADIAKELIASSDRGVYQSKASGRNAVHYVPMGGSAQSGSLAHTQ